MLEKKNKIFFSLFFTMSFVAFFLLQTSNILADEQFKPYLHKAVVPEHPKVKLYGSYSTELFPGAAMYTYQIDVPSGTNGLQPIVTLSYKSQSVKQRPGILGAGWTLTSTYIFRNVNSTSNDTSDDSFKLILNGAAHDLVYNTTDQFYHTKIETHMRIQNLSTTANNYNTYWLITTKEGIKYALGNSTSSELTSNTGWNYAVKWGLDEVEDTYGNNINYVYSENKHTEDNGSVYLDKILYNNEQARVIEFFYEKNSRPDRRLVYEQGNTLEESRRLSRINISVNNNALRSYELKYVGLNLGNSSSLTSIANISLLAPDGSRLHNVEFGYYNATHGFTRHNDSWVLPDFFQTPSAADTGVRLVDVNNDGWVDIVKGSENDGEKRVWINNGTGWVNKSSEWNFPLYIVDVNYTENGVRFVDVNNDGLVDIIQSSNKHQIVKSAYLHNGTGWIDASATWNAPVEFVTNMPNPNEVGDLGVNFVELNGDGRIDMIKAENGLKRTFLNNGSGWTETSNWTAPANFIGGSFSDLGLRALDLNSDGLDDLIEAQGTASSNTKNAWLNTGSGWVNASPRWLPPTVFTGTNNVDAGVRFADINGDGLVDMWHNGKDEDGVEKKIWLNNGSGWAESPGWTAPEQFVETGRNVGRRLVDFNGDGLPDIIASWKNSTDEDKHVWIKNSTIPYTLKSIKTELGANITIHYQNSTQYNHTNDSGVSRLGYNILLVSSVVQNNSLNGSHNAISNFSYNYTGGVHDNKDREFRGFGLVTEIMPDGTEVKHYFLQDAILKGKENRTEIYDNKGNLTSVQENTYNYTQTGSHFNVFLTSAATYTHDGQSANPKVTNATYTYDNYGNVATVTQLGDTSAAGDEKLERYDYVYNTSAWILDRQSWYRIYAGNTTTLRDVKYIYDDSHYGVPPSKGSVTSVQSWLDSDQNHQTSFSYGSKGEITSETDALGRETNYQYETTKTFPEQIINPLGHPTRFSYDLATGNLLWTEKNGVRTTFEYDKFGRIVTEIQPYDTTGYPTKEYTYSFDGTAPESIKVSQRTTANKTFDTFYFYDGFGQSAQIKSSAPDNQQAVKNFFYDGQGRVKAEQNPYFDTFSSSLSQPSATASFTNYTYDALDRVTNVTFPDFTNITVVFNHWTVSAYDQNRHRKDYYLDAYDRITKITEYNIDPVLNDGVVYLYNTTYGYDEADQLQRIVDAHGNNFTFTYDSLGRRTGLNDPDIAEWNYSYDLAGNLISQAGGGGNLITGGGFYREYNSLNQLIRIRNGSSINSPLLEEYTYDPYGERVKIWRNDSAGTVVYTPFREFMQIRNSSGIYNFSYIYDGSTLVARVNPDNTKHYYHPDHLGSTTLVTDSNGNVVEETFYEPYGDVDSGGTADVKLYLAEFSDSLTGQYLFGDRYFNPEWGRVIQPDDYVSYYNPQGLNRYAYGLNNPYKYKDDSGESPTLVLGAIGAVVGGGINLGVQLWQNNGDFSKVDYGNVAVSAGAGFIAGATLGIGTAVLGTGAGATIASGAAAGVAGGQAGILGENVLEGEPLTEGLLQPEDVLVQAGTGAAGAGIGYAGGKALTALGSKTPSIIGGQQQTQYRALTRSNFRENLARATGINPKGYEAHHRLPVKFERQFKDAGIEIHNPNYGQWVEQTTHRKMSYEYNKKWEKSFEKNPSKGQVRKNVCQATGNAKC